MDGHSVLNCVFERYASGLDVLALRQNSKLLAINKHSCTQLRMQHRSEQEAQLLLGDRATRKHAKDR